LRTGKLPFQIVERAQDRSRLECPVSSSDRRPCQDPGILQPTDGFIRLLVAPIDEVCSGPNRDDGCAGKTFHQEFGGGSSANAA